MCQKFGARPSEILALRANPWLAWQFDQAVSLFGAWVEAKLSERERRSGKPRHRIEDLLLPGGRWERPLKATAATFARGVGRGLVVEDMRGKGKGQGTKDTEKG
jgi:hypothetical protein